MKDICVPSVPMPCCGVYQAMEAVFKREYHGLAYEFKCGKCGHTVASASLPSSINAWNTNVIMLMKKQGLY